MTFASEFPNNLVRYRDYWWKDVNLKTFSWNGVEGPAGKSFDLSETAAWFR